VYWTKLVLGALTAGSVRQTESGLPSGSDQSLMVPAPPEASNSPSGLMATAGTQFALPVMDLRAAPSGNDQNLMAPSWPPETSRRPSGLMATANT
jgi:hypothetical protein